MKQSISHFGQNNRQIVFLLLILGAATAAFSQTPTITADKVLNAAGYSSGGFASDSWVTLYGANLAEAVIIAEDGLQTDIAGTRVTVTDSAGVEQAAALRFVAPNTLNFLAPSGMASGPATLTVTNPAGMSGSADVTINNVAPGLFAANEDGRGAAIATFLRVLPDGARTEGLTFVTNAIAGTRSNLPIPFAPAGSEIYLSLWGTGFRGASSVQVLIGDIDIPVLAAVAHSEFAGLDQAVIGPLPPELADAGEATIKLLADGVAANPVTISFLEEPGPDSRVVISLDLRIEGVERLVFKGNTVQWVHVQPEEQEDEERSTPEVGIETRINGRRAISASWTPRFAGRVPTEAGEASSLFTELWPPLPGVETPLSIERVNRFDGNGQPLPDRGEVRIVETPTAANDFTLVLELDDSETPGAGVMPLRIVFGPSE